MFKVASWDSEAAKDFGDHGDWERRANDDYPSRSLFHFNNASGCHRNLFFHRGVHFNSDFTSQKARKGLRHLRGVKEANLLGKLFP